MGHRKIVYWSYGKTTADWPIDHNAYFAYDGEDEIEDGEE